MRNNSPQLIDISVPIDNELPIWPGSTGVEIRRQHSIEKGERENVTVITIDVHTGTHIDAPLHRIKNGNTVDCFDLKKMIGNATVINFPEKNMITRNDMNKKGIGDNKKRLLLKTRNSEIWKDKKKSFTEDYVGLTVDAAEWIVENKIETIGIDYLSIEPYGGNGEVHKILMESGVVIIEGLILKDVDPGEYELICLPVYLKGTDGAMARAVLRKNENG